MNILLKSSYGYSQVSLESKMLADRKLFILGDITSDSATEFVQKVLYLNEEYSEDPINIYINSSGGEVTAGLMIYDTIKGLTAPVNTFCVGMAASMAAIILAGGQKGRRFILPHSKVMIHQPRIMGGVSGNASSLQKTAEMILETKSISEDLLANDTGKSKKEIAKAISYDHYMSAEEAVEFHICDEIITKLS